MLMQMPTILRKNSGIKSNSGTNAREPPREGPMNPHLSNLNPNSKLCKIIFKF
jgi:hypothetical protein